MAKDEIRQRITVDADDAVDLLNKVAASEKRVADRTR